ncbi:MAG: DUF669 domain-containing protein [Actinomycetes bacterium]
MTETTERVLDWDDEIENDGAGGDFITLPAGEYPFEVVGFERERYTPGPNAKLPACNKAVIEIRLDGGALGTATIKENLFLHSRTEGILCAFFTSIGARQHGQKVAMDWGRVIGSTGRAKVAIRKYDKDGEERTINQVKQWLEPSEVAQAAAGTRKF